MKPECLNQFFSTEQQRDYVAMLMGRGGLTRRRAEYFVRLWAYLLLKQKEEAEGQSLQPLSQLYPPDGFIACTHREAAELFYGNKDKGSDRAAGMMIDRLVALGLLEKKFDGQTLCLQVCPLPELALPKTDSAPIELLPDDLNPRTDAIPVANLFTLTYAELVKDGAAVSHKMSKAVRRWAQKYPPCMRVLRRSDNLNPVGVSILYPTASQSEFNFFQPPSKSFYVTNEVEVDPFEMADPGDPDCTSVYVRAWIIDPRYFKPDSLRLMLEDTKVTLQRMQKDFPNICDLYSPILHPLYEELRLALGFQKIVQDTQRSYYWVYLSVDRFLELDIPQALSNLKLGSRA
jgi:hypothetical protein